MARISTYTKDASITSDDKLLGSNYKGLDNQGRPIFATANFKIEDLLVYFSNNIDIGGISLSFLNEEVNDLNKLKEFYTFDENGNVTGVASAFAELVVNSTVADDYATASFQTNLEANVVTLDPQGRYVTSTAFANTVFNTTTSDKFATSQYAQNIGTSFGTIDANGNITISEAFADEVIDTTVSNKFATSQKVGNLGAAFGTFEGDNFSLAEANIQSIFDTFTELSFANSIYINNIESEVSGRPFVFRQDTPPVIYSGDPLVQVIPTGSLWYDTNDGNKVYIVDDPENTGTKTWQVTDDSRIGASAEKITNISAKFGTFDVNNNFTVDTNAEYFESVKTFVNDDSAVASKVQNLNAALDILNPDGSSKYTNAEYKDSIVTYVDTESTTASKVENLNTTLGILNPDGTVLKNSAKFLSDIRLDVDTFSNTASLAENLRIDIEGNGTEGSGLTAQMSDVTTLAGNLEGYLEARRTINVDANGNIASMQLYADAQSSEIRFTADSFKVYNGTEGQAPFIVEDGTVKIKSANIQQLSFGDLNNIPDTLVLTTVYADDGAGAGQSLTKGAKNFYGIYQGPSALEEADLPITGVTFNQITGDAGANGVDGADGANGADGADGANGADGAPGLSSYFHIKYSDDNGATFTGNNGEDPGDYIGTYSDNTAADSEDVSDYTWVKILGADGIQGPTGDRVYTTNLFYQTIVTNGVAPSFDTTNLVYNFNTAQWSGIPSGWDINPPSSSPGSGTNQLYYVSANAVEGSGVTVGNPTTYFNFNGLVTFTGNGNNILTDGTSNFDYTAIDGAWITTGAIKSKNFAYTDADNDKEFDEIEAVTLGTIFNLVDGYIKTPKFWLKSDGNAYFTGDLTGANGSFGDVTIDSSGISSTYFTANSSGASLIGSLEVKDADGDTAVLVHDGTFIGTEASGESSTAPTISNLSIQSWDNTKNITSTGETISSLRTYLEDNTIYGNAESITVPAGSFTHSLVTNAITNPLVSLSSDWYGSMGINLGIQFGNSDFSTIYYETTFPNIDIEAGESLALPAVSGYNISLVFTQETEVYVRFYLRRTWKTRLGTASFDSQTFTVSSNLQFAGVKGKTEVSPNGIQVFNTDDIYFKVDRQNFISGNPYVDIGGDVKIDGNLEVTGAINLIGDVNTSDVTVEKLRERLAQIDADTYLGESGGPTFTVRDNLSVVSGLTVGGNTTISGDLTVSGTTTTINATNLAISDNMIYLNDGNTTANPDLGFAGNYNDGTYAHAGLFRDADNGIWKFYDSYTLEPDASAFIDTSHASFALAPVQASHFYGSLTGSVNGNITTSNINYNGTVISATAAEINGLHNLTADRALITDANGKLATTVVTATALSYLDGAESNIQDQIDSKEPSITGAATTITGSNLTASRALISNASGKVSVSDITSTELGYLNNLTANVQTQINNIDAYLYKAVDNVNNTDGWVSLFEVKIPLSKGGSSAKVHVRTYSTNIKTSVDFLIVTNDDGRINIEANSTSGDIIRYQLIQDLNSPANYIFQVNNPSTENVNVQAFIDDTNKKGEEETGTIIISGFTTYASSVSHEIREFEGSRNLSFDTSVSGTNKAVNNTTIDGILTVDSINLTGLASSGGVINKTVLTKQVATTNSYLAASLLSPIVNDRVYMKFTIFGNGHFTEKTYVGHCNVIGNWLMSVATEESTGVYDISWDGTVDEFHLYRHTDTVTDNVTISVKHIGTKLNEDDLLLLTTI